MRASLFLAPLLVILGCCSPKGSDRPEAQPPPRVEEPAASDAGSPGAGTTVSTPRSQRGAIDPATVGSIRGTVRFEGEPPARKSLPIGGTAGCEHGKHETPLSEDVIVADGRLANVFVWIKDGHEGWDLPAVPDEPARMDQKGCVYRPHVIGMRVGQKLLVANSDPASHNVNIRSRANDSPNPIQPPGGKPIEWLPKRRETGVPFECNLHPWMRAFVHVVEHPWFAVSAPDGTFAIEGLPPGEYVLEAWHEKLGKKSVKAVVKPSAPTDVEISFRQP